ncbi:peptidase inhibitor family I36 protein (plasmid) [Streptomycetaceae bacterium NBC_01309]
MKMKIKSVAIAATVAGIATLGVASPAQAATGFDRCPEGRFCLFSQLNGQGTIAYFQWGAPDLRPYGVDGHAYSVWNRANRYFNVYSGYNYAPLTSNSEPGDKSNIWDWVAKQIHSVRVR